MGTALELAADSISKIPRRRDINLPRNVLQDLPQLGFQRAMMTFGSLPEPLDDGVVQPTYQDLAHEYPPQERLEKEW
jgi:hypothetical protein